MKRLLIGLLLLFLPALASAQDMRKAAFVTDYDLDSASYIYCVTTGRDADPYGPPRQGQTAIETSGSSTTVTAVTAGTNPFALLAVGDVILVQTAPGTTATRYITAKASADSITVNTAVNLDIDGGYSFTWFQVTCGTAATSGWIDVAPYSIVTVTWQIDQMNAASIDVLAEGEVLGRGSGPVQFFPPSPTGTGVCETGNFTAVRTCHIQISDSGFDRVRIGFRVNTDDGGDTGANAEDITAHLSVRKQN